MRRFALLLALLSVTALASSAAAQDTTAKRDTAAKRDSATKRDTIKFPTTHKRVRMMSQGEIDSLSKKPKLDTAKIRAPSRQDSSLARHEMRADTSSILRDTTARPRTPPDSQKPKKP
jgi:hypothetical protein